MPQISIIYSESKSQSRISKDLAFYLAASLVTLGNVKVALIPFDSNQLNSDFQSKETLKRLSYIPAAAHLGALDVPLTDITFDNFSILSACHTVIVTAECASEEIEGFLARKISQGLQNRKPVVVFLMQPPTIRKNLFKAKISCLCSGAVCLECVVGFSVFRDSKSQALMPVPSQPTILVPRLGKDIARVAEGPVSLLEATGIHLLYRPHNTGKYIDDMK